MVTGSPHLNLLAAAGWEVDAAGRRTPPAGEAWTVTASCWPADIECDHPNRVVAERMVVAACLVADGHDPVRLLADAVLVLGDDHQELRTRILRCLLVPEAEVVGEAVTVIGPECFASLDESVVCWRGVNYGRQDAS